MIRELISKILTKTSNRTVRNINIRYRLTESIIVVWPNGWTEPDCLGNSIQSSDPNDHLRPYLEKNIGHQIIDWDWHPIVMFGDSYVKIHLNKKYARHITHMTMIWKTV